MKWVLIGVVVTATSFAHGESENCEELPAARQAMCWMILSCAGIDDSSRRKECFDAAYEGFRDETRSASRALEDAPPAAPTRPEPARTAEIPTQPAEPAPRPAAPARETAPQPPLSRPAADAGVAIRERTESALVYDIPERFDALITYHRDLVRDRQLIVLDDTLLFEADGLAAGRLKVGQEVKVKKTSNLLGERFEITGRGRMVDAKRIPCEASDLSRDSLRKCGVLRPAGL